MNYTKGEWKLGGRWGLTSDLGNKLDALQVMSDGQSVIALVADGKNDNGKANAERIVTAVNCHDDLYEALRGITAQFGLVEPLYGRDRKYIEAAYLALSKAEVENDNTNQLSND